MRGGPEIVSKLKTEIQMRENRQLAAKRDTVIQPTRKRRPVPAFGYDSHYCNADRLVDPTILACSGTRSQACGCSISATCALPREIAYFNPGGNGIAAPRGRGPAPPAGTSSSQPRIIAERGEIWFTDHDRGFYVVRFTNGTWPFRAPEGE